MKMCPRCGISKPLREFVRNRTKPSGVGGYCKPCHAEIVRANVKKNHGSGRAFQLKRRYGIDATQAEWFLLQQNGRCAVCSTPDPAHVDHDHRTKEVRGIVCFNCNRGLGYFGDDLETLYKAADYLERP